MQEIRRSPQSQKLDGPRLQAARAATFGSRSSNEEKKEGSTLYVFGPPRGAV